MTEKNYGSPPPRWILRTMTAINVFVYKLSGGKMMNKLMGADICMITMKGARSGKTRAIPLMYIPYKEGLVLVASQGGAPANPTWYYNLVANPDITVEVHGKTLSLHARVANSEEKQEVWPICVEHYPDYDDYRHRTSRDIPVFICE
jgi:deazaflavin-dependent oxidoreductase (nitroreductase family)